MQYTVDRLRELFRAEVEDEVQPYLWSDAEFYEYLNEAQKEFARETDFFKDVSTPAITRLTVTADDPWVALDPRVVEVRRVATTDSPLPLQIANANELDHRYLTGAYGETYASNWDTAKGSPKLAVADLETDKLRLVPIPTSDTTLKLHVVRLPLNDVTGPDSELEISEDSYRRSLLMFAKAMAYEKQDAETYSPEKSASYRADFYNYCSIVKSRQTRKQRRVGTVRYAQW